MSPIDPAGVLLVSREYGDVLTGGAGADTLSGGQGPDRLTGGAGADVFVYEAMPWNGGQITDFEPGVDGLDISGLYVDGYAGADPVADGYVRFESNGAGGTKVMLDVDGPNAAAVTWSFHVATLDKVSPVGLTAAQVFGQAAPSDLLLVSDRYADILTGGAGNDTLVAGQGPDRLTGGPGADVFVYQDQPWTGGQVMDFELGVDRLDISKLIIGGYAGRDPVADGYVRFETNGAGGTKVMLDADGPGSAQAWSKLVAILEGLSPEAVAAGEVFGAPDAAGVNLSSTRHGDHLIGGAGADTLAAGQGPDQLTGGAGGDRFVFSALPWSAGHITDFQPGIDVLDLRPLFAEAGYAGADPLAESWLRFEADGASTRVMFDPDGPGAGPPWAFQITVLDAVSPWELAAGDWLVG